MNKYLKISIVLVLAFSLGFLGRVLPRESERVYAQELYDEFSCPCCTDTIGDCACPMAKERQNYIDSLLELGETEESEIILGYVEKYGLSSMVDDAKAQKIKDLLIDRAPADRPAISLSPSAIDLGEVSVKKGRVQADFVLENKGDSDLVIDRLETSCGCTTVRLILEDGEGPLFGMPGHGLNEKIKDWTARIESGGTVRLRVYYDPSVHPNFEGSVIRTISVFSNDPVNTEARVQIELKQILE